MLNRKVLFLICAFVLAQTSWAGEHQPGRALVVGPSFSMLTSKDVLSSKPFSPGLFANYEFLVTPHFRLALHMGYKSHASEVSLRQLVYGVLLKHVFADPSATIAPFLQYGLLLNMAFLSDRVGSGTTHDTKLGGGLEFTIGEERFLAGIAYHYSRLGFFGSPKLKLDAFEFELGWMCRW